MTNTHSYSYSPLLPSLEINEIPSPFSIPAVVVGKWAVVVMAPGGERAERYADPGF